MKKFKIQREWKKIEPSVRAHVILVKEKAKVGATLGSFKNISGILTST
jgi:hypothetical protein